MLQFIAQLRRKCLQIVLAMTTKITIDQITKGQIAMRLKDVGLGRSLFDT
jgi:hypothetical protein